MAAAALTTSKVASGVYGIANHLKMKRDAVPVIAHMTTKKLTKSHDSHDIVNKEIDDFYDQPGLLYDKKTGKSITEEEYCKRYPNSGFAKKYNQ